jgi:Fur family transcriptional regulator, ferric uptake regulator
MSLYTADSLKAELHEKGWRLTPQREIILDIFQNLASGKHLSAEDLQEVV